MAERPFLNCKRSENLRADLHLRVGQSMIQDNFMEIMLASEQN